MEKFRGWFLAAAIYNALWGGAVALVPAALFRAAGLQPSREAYLFQCIGMTVGVYALGYWLVWRDPKRYGAFVWVGILGKVLGPVGFVIGAMRGEIPWEFGRLIAFNDLPWLPAFVLFARKWAAQEKANRDVGSQAPGLDEP